MEKGKHYKMASGAQLFVSVSEYEKVIALHDALIAELRGGGVGGLDIAAIQKAFDAEQSRRAAAAAGTPFDDDGSANAGHNAIVDKILGVAASKSVKSALFACAEKAVYMPNGNETSSIQFQLGSPGYGVFDNPKCLTQAREDYYDICRAIAEENLRPFAKALFSMFMAHMASSADTPASPSAQG